MRTVIQYRYKALGDWSIWRNNPGGTFRIASSCEFELRIKPPLTRGDILKGQHGTFRILDGDPETQEVMGKEDPVLPVEVCDGNNITYAYRTVAFLQTLELEEA